MAASSLLLNVQLAFCTVLADAGWPNLTMLAIASAISVPCLLLCVAIWKLPCPKVGERKWVLLAGVFFGGSTLFMMLSVHVGMPLGDFAALNSANIVFAVFLGRIFLGEPLHWVHFAAVVSSVAGAVLISQPEILFGHSDGSSANSWGYLLALASGLCDACIYICTRKASQASPWLVAVSFFGNSAVALLVGAAFIVDSTVAPLIVSPLEASGLIAALFAIGMIDIVTFAGAAQWCPAAVSATVDTATRMVSGYAAQVFFFDAPIKLHTLGGAALMFLSVAALALFQAKPAEPGLEAGHGDLADDSKAPDAAMAEEDSDTESLASFIASEFVGITFSQPPLRLRRTGGGASKPAAQVIGVLTSVVASA